MLLYMKMPGFNGLRIQASSIYLSYTKSGKSFYFTIRYAKNFTKITIFFHKIIQFDNSYTFYRQFCFIILLKHLFFYCWIDIFEEKKWCRFFHIVDYK